MKSAVTRGSTCKLYATYQQIKQTSKATYLQPSDKSVSFPRVLCEYTLSQFIGMTGLSLCRNFGTGLILPHGTLWVV